MKQQHIIDAAIERNREGLRLTTYLCPAGKLTIGYGHTGPDVKAGMTITKEEAEKLLSEDIADAAAHVDALVKVDLSDSQFSALVDFVFNLGASALAHSTLLEKLNAGDYLSAGQEFPKWDKAHVDGELVEVEGLKERRLDEQARFLVAA